MILVDTNVLMYAAGVKSPQKDESARFLDRVGSGEVDAVVDAEVLQEVLHRYRALDRWEDGRKVYDLARVLFPVVLPTTVEVLDRARELLDVYPHLMARDALHAAVTLVEELDAICSYDRDFDAVRRVRRLEPKGVP